MEAVPGRGIELSLGELQELFVSLESRWVAWVLSHPGWKLRHGEGRILPYGPDGKSGRVAREIGTNRVVQVMDLVHKENGAHAHGIGADWQLFVDGKYITRSDDPAWLACGEYWTSLHGLCRWGGDFRPIADGNHISLFYRGVA